ncbi:MAG: FAD-dependent oxidoreductase [Deltaproteobacteria bacterium]|nr:FAD-dependent oxidoreductase [Deltaproteobacteria bacterium]
MHYDVLIVGGGIAGMEAGLTLGDMGYSVLLVEKESSIGGKMILLSKVFPTLDCASCIATPKMAATANHKNITVMPYSEVDEIERQDDGSFKVRMHRKPSFVDPVACTGCAQCEIACTVAIADQFNMNLVARRSAHIAYPQAVPKKAIIDRVGLSPCSHTCPAGVKAHGYVSLVRAGKYKEAFNLHMEDAPLPGSLSRACYAPCEEQCTRGQLEGPVSIRGIKRFMVDRYYAEHAEPEYGPAEEQSGKKVAVVGSGPAGLSAAYFLAKNGHGVEIFEAAPKAGGMLRCAIPAYRLPKDIVDRDIKNITALGVPIHTSKEVSSIDKLKKDGFDAVFLALGTMDGRKMNIPGEDLEGVMDCMTFLKGCADGSRSDLKGKHVVIVGGGNSAIDPARLAKRMGAARVCIHYRRSRAQMPAHDWEVQAAIDEGIELHELSMPTRFTGSEGQLKGLSCIDMKLGEPDESGRRRPVPIEGSEKEHPVDIAVLAIGLNPSTRPFAAQLKLNKNETIEADEESLQTSVAGVYAGGDVVSGPSMIVEAIGQGKRAAFHMDRFLSGLSSSDVIFDDRLSMVSQEEVLQREGELSHREPIALPELPMAERLDLGCMEEVELTMSEEDARASANRCMDCGGCSECHECITACPADAIHFDLRREDKELDVGSVIMATGFKLFNPSRKPLLGYDRFPNVIDAMQMDRILSPTRPYNAVVRPSDGMEPANIAFVLCVGSRDESVGNRLCSQVCCMYSAKQSQLIMGALPLADITIYYIDIRAFGKGYDEFYEQAKGMGVYFTKGRVGRIEESENQNLTLHYEDILNGGGMKTAEHDLVVLSVGLLPQVEVLSMFTKQKLDHEFVPYIKEIDLDLNPGKTSIDGVFVAGAASSPRDIPDTIVHAGAAAAQAAGYLTRNRSRS